MIGNDIVDLELAATSSRWLKQRAWDKVFTSSEQEQIRQSYDRQFSIWRLWSMKESAYKAFVQQQKRTFIRPTKINCQILSDTAGVVHIDGWEFSCNTRFARGVIHSISKAEDSSASTSEWHEVRSTTFKGVRMECYEMVLSAFAKSRMINVDALEIRKNQLGIPQIFDEGKKQDAALSISHHGRYYAFAFGCLSEQAEVKL